MLNPDTLIENERELTPTICTAVIPEMCHQWY